MRILYLCFDTGIDLSGLKGASIHVRSFVRALAELGHEVTVVGSKVGSPDSFEAATQATVVRAPLARWNHALSRAIKAGNRLLGRSPGRGRDVVRAFHNPEFFRIVEESAARLEPTFIYERYSLWGMAGERLARKWSIPLVLEVNSPLTYEEERYREGLAFPSFARWAERRIWRRADLLLAVSEALRSHFEKAGAAARNIRILPNAVDAGLFATEVDEVSLRSRLGLGGRFVVGFVGSFKAWHGLDFLLQAFARLHAEDPSFHLMLIGDGPMRATLEEEARRLGLKEAVTLVGSVPHEEVPRYLSVIDVAVAPYPVLEDFYYSPLKLYEYMAGSRAVVASRIGQVTEVVADGLTGLLYKPGDREGLIQCIRRLRTDETLRRELGKNARIACSKNTWSQSAGRVVDWVAPLLDHKTLVYATG
jgi:glycosyltransferase involved in cell wall biosynthesis